MKNPISLLKDEAFGGIDAGFFVGPLVIASTIPDVCSALEAEEGRTTRLLYKAWFDAWLAEKMTLVTADDLYGFRCGMVHQGKASNLKHGIKRIAFSLDTRPGSIRNNRYGATYLYGIREFCEDVFEASDRWFDANKNNDIVNRNSMTMLAIHPHGLAGAFGGVAVLA